MRALSKRRIGLLGGSFNPAHEGHVHISLQAIKRLQLDEVWWLVSPKNPLKEASGLADVQTRLSIARTICKPHKKLIVRDDEITQKLFYTVDTVAYFQRRYAHTRFVWLMGADNLAQFHRWRGWQKIALSIRIAVLDRAPYSFKSLASKAAKRLAKKRLPASSARLITSLQAPIWVYLSIPRHPLSATQLRKKLGKNAFLRHSEDN
jgi:nicotinate-nucleotide adenylyltransferase